MNTHKKIQSIEVDRKIQYKSNKIHVPTFKCLEYFYLIEVYDKLMSQQFNCNSFHHFLHIIQT